MATTMKLMTIAAPDIHDSAEAVFASAVPFDTRHIGAAAVYCSDGRFVEQIDEFLHLGLGLPRYDRLALPGGAACLAGHVHGYHDKAALQRQLDFLIRAHELTRVVLISHHDCAFYKHAWLGLNTPEQQQSLDLRIAADEIRRSNPQVGVEAYFARKRDGRVLIERRAV